MTLIHWKCCFKGSLFGFTVVLFSIQYCKTFQHNNFSECTTWFPYKYIFSYFFFGGGGVDKLTLEMWFVLPNGKWHLQLLIQYNYEPIGGAYMCKITNQSFTRAYFWQNKTRENNSILQNLSYLVRLYGRHRILLSLRFSTRRRGIRPISSGM